MSDLPTVAKGVVIGENGTLSYGELPLPQIGENDVLVKIHSAGCNPSDVLFTMGLYPANKPRPCFAGFEGSGVVIAGGSSATAQELLNRNVAFFASENSLIGTWADYAVFNAERMVPIPENLTLEEGAYSIVNPLTVQAFIYESVKNGYKCIIHSAAASALGRMLVSACKQAGITLINIVRKTEQVEILKGIGADHIINTSEPNWKEIAANLFEELKVQAFFDAIGGETAGDIIKLMPNNTVTFNYGVLSGKDIPMSGVDLIFKGKVLKGLWVTTYLADKETAMNLFGGALGNLATKAYTTTIAKKFTFPEFADALTFYGANSTQGKILLQNPNF